MGGSSLTIERHADSTSQRDGSSSGHSRASNSTLVRSPRTPAAARASTASRARANAAAAATARATSDWGRRRATRGPEKTSSSTSNSGSSTPSGDSECSVIDATSATRTAPSMRRPRRRSPRPGRRAPASSHAASGVSTPAASSSTSRSIRRRTSPPATVVPTPENGMPRRSNHLRRGPRCRSGSRATTPMASGTTPASSRQRTRAAMVRDSASRFGADVRTTSAEAAGVGSSSLGNPPSTVPIRSRYSTPASSTVTSHGSGGRSMITAPGQLRSMWDRSSATDPVTSAKPCTSTARAGHDRSGSAARRRDAASGA